MKKFKKIISVISLLAMSISILPMSAMAETETVNKPETVWYENNFDNGSEDRTWTTDSEYFNGGYTNAETSGTCTAVTDVTVDGNKGVYIGNSGAYATGHTFFFDFTKSGEKSGLTKGKLKFSFDFKMNASSTANRVTFGINASKTATYQGNVAMQIDRTTENDVVLGRIWTKNDAAQWDASTADSKATNFNLNGIHRMEIVLNMNEGYQDVVDYYLDGEQLTTSTNFWGDSVNNVAIAISGQFAYFDNLKLSMLNADSTYSFTSDAEFANGYADVVFEAPMNVKKGAFIVDGYEADEVDWLDLYTARVYSPYLSNSGEHTISVSGATDLYGVAPQNSSVTVNTIEWDSEYVMYEATFDNTNTGLYWEENHEAFTGGYNSSCGDKPGIVPFGGNKGIGFHNGAYPSGSTFYFDFTKGGTLQAPTSGKMKFSFDFVLQETTDPKGSSFIKNSLTTTSTSEWSGGGFIYKDGTPYLLTFDNSSYWLNLADVNQYGTPLDFGPHTLDIIIEHYDQARLHYYLDGVKIPHVFNYWTKAKSFGFAMSGIMKYVDNVKLSYVKNGSFGVENLKTPMVGENTLTLYITEQAQALNTTDVTVTKNGATITPTAVNVKTIPVSLDNNTRYAVEITLPEAVTDGAEYTVALASTVKSVYGYAVNENYNTASAKTTTLPEVTSLVIEDGVAKAVVVNNEVDAITPIMLIASYDTDGALTGVIEYKGYEVDGFGATSIDAGKVAKMKYNLSSLSGTVKVFLWSDYISIKPLAPSVAR